MPTRLARWPPCEGMTTDESPASSSTLAHTIDDVTSVQLILDHSPTVLLLGNILLPITGRSAAAHAVKLSTVDIQPAAVSIDPKDLLAFLGYNYPT